MTLLEQPEKGPFSWFKIGIVGLLLLSLALRFWGLSRFNTLVFDEVYYVKFAHNYLTQTPFFDGHPPLSKYLIAIGIWIGSQLPFGQDSVNSLAGAPYSTWSYRWLNAFTGSLIPLVVAGIAYQLTSRRSYAFVAGAFATLDGLFLVESRYALNNVYLVLFGLLGFWFLLRSLNSLPSRRRDLWLAASGIAFSASASVKWNGLWFLLGAYGLWISAWMIHWLQSKRSQVPRLLPMDTVGELDRQEPDAQDGATVYSPLEHLTRLKLWQIVLNWAVIPAVFYYLFWIPHLHFNTQASFWELQKQILQYHEQVGNGPNVHPYCSNWYTWLLMLRPVAYFYQVTFKGMPLPTGNSTLAPGPNTVIYDVHAIGNPILWWLSTAAILVVLWAIVQQVFNWIQVKRGNAQSILPPKIDQDLALNPTERWLVLFLAVNYATNLLPWLKVTRCLFLYHYMGASVFASMGLAWMIDRWLSSVQPRLRLMGIATMLLIVLGFVFWLPLYLGLPLTPAGFQWRMWFPSWI